MEAIFREFIKESPDYNFIISEGHIERIAANRVILTIMTEFSMMNNRRMKTRELLSFIESLQMVTGSSTIMKRDIPTPVQVKNIISIKPFTMVPSGETAIEGMA